MLDLVPLSFDRVHRRWLLFLASVKCPSLDTLLVQPDAPVIRVRTVDFSRSQGASIGTEVAKLSGWKLPVLRWKCVHWPPRRTLLHHQRGQQALRRLEAKCAAP